MNISDFKSSPFDIYNGGNNGNPNFAGTPLEIPNGYTGTGLNGIPDYSYDTLCGVKFSTEDGRVVTLVSNSANAQVAGTLLASPAELTAFQGLAMTVPFNAPATEGTFIVSVTNGATVLGQNIFAEGLFIVASGTGAGQSLKIASHQAAATTAQFLVTLEDPIQVTLDATSVINLVLNPYKNVIISPTTLTGIPVGVTLYPVPASVAATFDGTTGLPVILGIPQYLFVVSHGVVGCLIDGTVTNVGYGLGASATVAGALGIQTLTASPKIAIAAQTLTSGRTGEVAMEL